MNKTFRLLPEHASALGDAAQSPGAFTATLPRSGFAWTVPAGAFDGKQWLSADLLLQQEHTAVFFLTLAEENGKAFHLSFGLLPWCEARLRLPLSALDQNRWMFEREGALLKPICHGDVIDPLRIREIRLTLLRTDGQAVRWSMGPLGLFAEAPDLLANPRLPRGPLADELGQSTLSDWPGKARSLAEAVDRLRAEEKAAATGTESPGAGDRSPTFAASGFFRREHDGRRWWLVDPQGKAFFSSGPDCVRLGSPSVVTGLEAAYAPLSEADAAACQNVRVTGQILRNHQLHLLRQAFGERAREAWETLTLAQLRSLGFNTIANWSDGQMASRHGFPHVRPLQGGFPRTPKVFRDLPDVFHPDFAAECDAYAEQLRPSAGDPALMGYFLMNEPTWGFATQTPAEGMLRATPACLARLALRDFLRERHGDEAGLQRAWGPDAGFAAVAEGLWTAPFTAHALDDLRDFSEILVTRFFTQLGEACRRVDPHHLNLGVRHYTIPPDWLLRAMRSFDVFSFNCYEDRIPAENLHRVAGLLGMPFLIGEWHFGALDAGLPATGIGAVHSQADRARAFQAYLEEAASHPACVGAHWFEWNDQPVLGRFDGECYNIGVVDATMRPYPELARAIRACHGRLPQILGGELPPTQDRPDYLPRLFF